jgi:hypothetical protein
MSAWFEEVQRLRDNRWIYALVMVIALGAFLPLANGLYQQLMLNESWGNQPMSDEGLILLTVFVTVSCFTAAFCMLSIKLETRIDEQGIHYKFFPIKRGWRRIIPEEIASYTIEKKFQLFDGVRVGYRKNAFKKMQSFKVSGNKHLSLKLKNGTRLLLGTQSPEGIEWALRKLFKKNEMI